MAMPQNSTGENGFCFAQTLDFSHLSPPPGEADRTFAAPSGREPCGTPLSNGTASSGAPSPADSCAEPLCSAAPGEEGTRFGQGIKYVSAEGEELACGWGGFTPGCLQLFNTSKGVLFFLCMASFLQGMTVNGFINTVITSIERRFDLRSYQSGLIASSYDIAACVCLTFVSYFGGNGHKPRWLGWGVLVMGLGSLLFALPHFTTGRYETRSAVEVGVCGGNQSLPCSQAASSLSSYMFVFMLGQFLHGMGATPLYTLGVTYLDENVKTNYSPVYIGEWSRRGSRDPREGEPLRLPRHPTEHAGWLHQGCSPSFVPDKRRGGNRREAAAVGEGFIIYRQDLEAQRGMFSPGARVLQIRRCLLLPARDQLGRTLRLAPHVCGISVSGKQP